MNLIFLCALLEKHLKAEYWNSQLNRKVHTHKYYLISVAQTKQNQN